MKTADVLKVLENEFGISDLQQINILLKKQPTIKFRIVGQSPKTFGFTGQIKSISEEGVKAFMSGRVSLIRLEHIDTFEIVKSRSESSVKPIVAKATAAKAPVFVKDTEDGDEDTDEVDDDEGFDVEDMPPKRPKRNKGKGTGKNGSKFIPAVKK